MHLPYLLLCSIHLLDPEIRVDIFFLSFLSDKVKKKKSSNNLFLPVNF